MIYDSARVNESGRAGERQTASNGIESQIERGGSRSGRAAAVVVV